MCLQHLDSSYTRAELQPNSLAIASDFARSRQKFSAAGQDDVDRRHRSVSSWLSSTECLLHIRIARGGLIFHLILCTRDIASSTNRK